MTAEIIVVGGIVLAFIFMIREIILNDEK